MGKKDFLGFTFNGRHSSEFGIVRVINGKRMKEELFPESADITQNIEGADGTIYYGTNYKKREFTIDFAFDGMEEKQKKDMQGWLSVKKIGDLSFDERPEIKYSAKVTGKTVISFIPFDNEKEETVYKGEGTIIFTCYYSFGRKNVEAVPLDNTYTFGEDSDCEMLPLIRFNELPNSLEIKRGTEDGEILMVLNNSKTLSDVTIDCKRFLIYDNNYNIYNDKIVQGDFFSASPGETFYFSVQPSKILYDELYY